MEKDKINLVGPTIRLRPMTANDLPLKVKWYNDPRIRKTLIIDERFQLDKTVDWFNSIQDSDTRLDLMIETCDGNSIGVIGLANVDGDEQSAEIFIVIGDTDYWAKGVMLEAERLLIQWAFEEKGLKTIWAHSRCENIASVITMKKLGFEIKETQSNYTVIDGESIDVFYVVLNKDCFKPLVSG